MSEESKIDSDYVHMFDGNTPPTAAAGGGGGGAVVTHAAPDGLDDPNLSQEERDLRLAIALQQQENSAALTAAKIHKAEQSRTNILRSGRSGAQTGLAHIRAREKMGTSSIGYANAGAADVISEYVAPMSAGGVASNMSQEAKDYQLAVELQKVEASSVGSAKLAQQLSAQDQKEKAAGANRVGRSGY